MCYSFLFSAKGFWYTPTAKEAAPSYARSIKKLEILESVGSFLNQMRWVFYLLGFYIAMINIKIPIGSPGPAKRIGRDLSPHLPRFSAPLFCLVWVFYSPRTPGNSTWKTRSVEQVHFDAVPLKLFRSFVEI